MKQIFFQQLRKELEDLNVDQEKIESIMSDHERTFDLGREAGLNDSEIIGKLGSPKMIALKYKNNNNTSNKNEKEEKEYKGVKEKRFFPKDYYSIHLNLVNENVEIVYHDEEYIKFSSLDDFDESKFYFGYVNNVLKIENKAKFRVFKKESRITMYLYLPLKYVIQEIKIKDVNSRLSISRIEALKFSFSSVNGKVTSEKIVSPEVIIKTTNGELKMGVIDSATTTIETVNGRIELNELNCEKGRLNVVTGSIKVTYADKEKITSSATIGKIVILGKKEHTTMDSFKESMNGFATSIKKAFSKKENDSTKKE